jgi:uncharacterized membrane protein YqjE
MPGPVTPEERPAGDAGLIEHVRSLAASFAGYLHARFRLAGLESREAFAHYLKIILWAAAAVLTVVFGYLFFGVALVFLVAHLLHCHWVPVMLGFGALHFAFAFVCLLIVRKKLPEPVFNATINEFKKDQEWLTTPVKPN